MRSTGVALLLSATAVAALLPAPAVAAKDLPPADPLIATIQGQLAAFDGPSGYYTTTYRPSEQRYWAHLPAWIRRDAATHHAARVLDIGCGYGTLLAFAAEVYHADPYCMDMVHYMPAFGEARGFHFVSGNVQLDPLPEPGTFDVIVMTEVLEHFNFDPLPTFVKIREAMTPGAVFFLSTPDAAEWGRQTKYYSRLSDLPPADRSRKFIDDHVWVYDKRELMRLMSAAGLTVGALEYSPGVGHRHFNLEIRKKSL